MMRRWLLPLLLLAPLAGRDLSSLPEWARPHAGAALAEQAPKDADAWVLFDRTEVAYRGDGEVQTRHLRLVQVLTDRGRTEALFTLGGLGGGASKVQKLKGWNLRPDGEVTKVEGSGIVSFENTLNSEARTMTQLARVEKGSLVAFESLQTQHHPLGPMWRTAILESHPIRRWEMEPARKEGWFTDLKAVAILVDRHHFEPWLTSVAALGEAGLAVDRVPALPKDEFHRPHDRNVLPWIGMRFLDPDLKSAPPWADWDGFARWTHARFAEKVTKPELPAFKGEPRARLAQLLDWMARQLRPQAVYQTPERGWIPLDAGEVGRRRYGDCKDLSTFLMAGCAAQGLQACPVLALVLVGKVEEHEPPGPIFNHVITAIHLDESFGLPAEVETPEGRFLLVDPVDRFTPLGMLNEKHRGGRLLICTAKGGLWVAAPAAAIQASKVTLGLKGKADPFGVLRATLTVTEEGEGWGLRAAAQESGSEAFQSTFLAKALDLPPLARVKVLKSGEPLDLTKPFTVEFELIHPEGFKPSRKEAALPPLGWRIVPSQAQKPGVPRCFPVSQGEEADFEFTCELTAPFGCVPILPAQEGGTPFRAFTWSAKAEPEGAGTRLTLHLVHHRKHAYFGFQTREEGAAASRKDRAQVMAFMADALAFKVAPL